MRTVSKGVEEFQKKVGGALLIITHSTRILESLKVDRTHIMVRGRIVKEGDASLVDEVNRNGFDKLIPEDIKEMERKERLAAAAKAAMEAVKSAEIGGGV